MGILDDAKFAVAKINAMKSNGATSIKSAIAAGVKPTEDEELVKCVATFTQGAPVRSILLPRNQDGLHLHQPHQQIRALYSRCCDKQLLSLP